MQNSLPFQIKKKMYFAKRCIQLYCTDPVKYAVVSILKVHGINLRNEWFLKQYIGYKKIPLKVNPI